MSGLAEGLSEADRCDVLCGALAGVCYRHEHALEEVGRWCLCKACAEGQEMVAGASSRHHQQVQAR